MAAPSGTSWGGIVGGYGRIGIYITSSSTATVTTYSVQVWFWSKYSVTDSGNTFYANWGTTNAATSQGSRSIKHTVASGSGWSTSNQTLLGSFSTGYSRGTSGSGGYFAAKLAGIDRVGGTMTHYVGFTVPARPAYTITYNANGGTGAPGAQTQWHDIGINLSSVKPTRTGYTFLGWSLSSTATSPSYQPGQSWSGSNNANYTLYAVWKIITYAVTYDANGGTAAPAKQSKQYGKNLVLTKAKPTRAEYNFLGWGLTKDSTTIAYKPGATYTENKALTLYAIWEIAYVAPRITNLVAERCLSNKTITDEGTYLLIKFNWATDENAKNVKIEWKKESEATYTGSSTVTITGKSGAVNTIAGSGGIDTEFIYNVRITVTDAKGNSSEIRNIASMEFVVDFLAGGGGVAFGKVATLDNTLESEYKAKFNKEIYDRFNRQITNGLTLYTGSGAGKAIDANTTLDELILTDVNCPSATLFYVQTYFYGSKKTTSNRMQQAFPYSTTSGGSMYHRVFFNGKWSPWKRHTNADEFADKAVGRSSDDLWDWREYDDGTVELWLQWNGKLAEYSTVVYGSVYNYLRTKTFDYPDGLKLNIRKMVSASAKVSTGISWIVNEGGDYTRAIQIVWMANTKGTVDNVIRAHVIGQKI